VGTDAGAPPSCTSPADCDDHDAATLDLCTGGTCSHTPVCTGPNCGTDPCKADFAASGELKVTMLDVGQGDSIAILAPGGCAALVDGGPKGSGTTIKAHFAASGVSRLDFAVASHYHADHIGGLDEVTLGTGALSVRTVYDRGPASVGTQSYEQYADRFSAQRKGVSMGQTFTLCDQVCFRVVQVNGAANDDENAHSVVLRMNHGRFSMLLGGDLTGSTPDLESGMRLSVGAVDVYKVHHHGSGTSSNPTFLLWLDPTVSLVSVGWNNTYGHPHLGTLGRLQAIGSAIWMTEEDRPLGPIDVTVSGPTYRVSQAGRSVDYPVREH
jgi:beta-lactamase superfamily II metal-dependent hydrolase